MDNGFLQAALEGLEQQKARIEAMIAEVRAMMQKPKGKRISAAGRKRIADAQRKRWAKARRK